MKYNTREKPRPFHQRFVESNDVPDGSIAILCMCGNSFQKPVWNNQKYCSDVCVRRYARIDSKEFKELGEQWKKRKEQPV